MPAWFRSGAADGFSPRALADWVLIASVAILPVLTLVASPGITALLAVNALFCLPAALQGRALFTALRDRLTLAMLTLAGLGVLSALWSLDQWDSATRGVKLLLLLCLGTVVVVAANGASPATARRLTIAALGGLALAAFMAFSDWNLMFPLMMLADRKFYPRPGFYSRGATLAVLLGCVACLGLLRLKRNWASALLYAGIGLMIVLKLDSRSAFLAWALAGLIFALGRLRLRPIVFALVPAIGCLVAPLAVSWLPDPAISGADQAGPVLSRLPPSSLHRIVIWRFTGERIAERPIMGWGLEASRDIPEGRRLFQLPVGVDGRGNVVTMPRQYLPLHPHSLSLQVWLELGAVGALILAYFLYCLIDRAGARSADRASSDALVALAYAAIAVANVSYGAWQSWWLSAVWLVAAAAAAMTRAGGRE